VNREIAAVLKQLIAQGVTLSGLEEFSARGSSPSGHLAVAAMPL
jgi:hypothetical protein